MSSTFIKLKGPICCLDKPSSINLFNKVSRDNQINQKDFGSIPGNYPSICIKNDGGTKS